MVVNFLSVILIVTVFTYALSTSVFSYRALSLDHNIWIMAQTDSTESLFSLSNLVEQGSPYIGNLSAPITIVDFSDFQCHLCARYVENT